MFSYDLKHKHVFNEDRLSQENGIFFHIKANVPLKYFLALFFLKTSYTSTFLVVINRIKVKNEKN